MTDEIEIIRACRIVLSHVMRHQTERSHVAMSKLLQLHDRADDETQRRTSVDIHYVHRAVSFPAEYRRGVAFEDLGSIRESVSRPQLRNL